MKYLGYILTATVLTSTAFAKDSFDGSSDGYTWRSASLDFRKNFCNQAAAKAQNIKPGITGHFIFDAMQEFYTTDDTNLLKKKLFDIMALAMHAYE